MSPGNTTANITTASRAQNIKVVSFDLDDTLWPCLPTIERAEDLLYRWMMEHVPAITQHYDAVQLREKRQALITGYPELAHDLSALRIKSFELLTQEFSLSENWISPAFDIFYQARQQVTLFDDVEPVLDELKRMFQLVSLTNGNASTVATGIDHWFDFSLNSATTGRMKSEPAIYQQVLQQAGIEARQMLHVGDHPVQDVSGAKSAGILAVWLNRQGDSWPLHECQPDAVISSLAELPALLMMLNEKP